MVNKKASLDKEQIVVLILLLAFAGLFLYYLTNFQETEENVFDSEVCRLSVIRSSIPTQGASSLEQLKGCKPTELTIEESEPEIIHKTLSNSIADCWYKFGQGKVPFRGTFGTSNKHNLCLICSKIDYISDFEGISSNNLEEFLKKENSNLNNINKIFLFDKLKKDDKLYAVFLTGRLDIEELNKEYEEIKSTSKNKASLLNSINDFFKLKLLTISGVENSVVLLVPKESITQCLELR